MRLTLCVLLLFVVTGCVRSPQSNTPPVPVAPPGAQAPPSGGADDPGAADAEFITTDSGLKYRILRASEGRKPTAADTVTCHYRGWLDDETEFDSSYKRGKAAEFPLSGVVAGWTEGLQLVGEGGKIELEIPYQLGYGEPGRPGSIPPKATLHFVVELLSIR
jgi:FKBP-type peptidyl-prolyl cis-trans isomerase FkpA